MAVNERVSAQVNVLWEAYETDKYKAEKEKYWKIFDEEYRKEYAAGESPMGWAGYEDPADALYAAVDDGLDKEFLAEVLAEYKRFWGLVEAIEGSKRQSFDEELVKEAEERLANG